MRSGILVQLFPACQAFFGGLARPPALFQLASVVTSSIIAMNLSRIAATSRQCRFGAMRTKSHSIVSSRERLRDAAKRFFAERGFETASTAEICRLAGTSQSQLVKHFGSKLGVLEAIFEHAWEQINPAVQLAIEKVASPRERLQIVVNMVLTFLTRDPQLRILFLLEGRRIRGGGHLVVLTPGYLEFVKTLDFILKDMASRSELAPGIHPQALRSALMGALEGLLRDQLIARTSRYHAAFTEADALAVFARFLTSCATQ
jgi:AcrR family transcriptional regulator